MEDFDPPIILCMENSAGQEVALPIEPYDDFQSFLDKAKSLLGYDIDLNSVTKNQPVSLKDNIYQYLSTADHGLVTTDLTADNNDAVTKNPDSDNDSVYILDDGTQIKTSQIQFDNEDAIIDLTEEKIPFVRCNNDTSDEADVNCGNYENKDYNIVGSPVSRWSSNNSSPTRSFIDSLPFKLVCNTSSFQANFNTYLENHAKTYTTLNNVSSKNKSPRSIIREEYKGLDDSTRHKNAEDITTFSREEILNMFKDAPVASIAYDSTQNYLGKRRHVRKTDPTRPGFKPLYSKSYTDFDPKSRRVDNENCFICKKYINEDKLYILDNKDQNLQTNSPKIFKVICSFCLDSNYRRRIRNVHEGLAQDECLVVRNNQQYIFQKNNESNVFQKNVNQNTVNDFKIKEQSVEGAANAVKVKDQHNDSSSDVEIIDDPVVEIEDNIIDNIDEADDDVKEFLGKYQTGNDVDMKCRFCDRTFANLTEVTEHGEEHKHKVDDGEVYPCPICDYGYSNFKWLKAHLKAAHEKPNESKENNDEESKDKKGDELNPEDVKKEEGVTDEPENVEPERIIKTEVKQEALDTSDEEAIWIVHADDDEDAAREKIQSLFQKRKRTTNKCFGCSVNFPSAEKLAHHKCRLKRRPNKDEDEMFVPSEEDFIKRARGRPRAIKFDDSDDSDLLVRRGRKKKRREPTSDPIIVTCHDCNASFTSKVRLKFHMRFHEGSKMLRKSGEYVCTECDGVVCATEAELFDHVHFRHGKRKRWQCPVKDCGKTFYLRATLTKHSRTHTDTRRYVCVTCGKRFLDKQTLDEHGVTHLQIKPFQCHICLKQLTRRSRLRMHLRAHEEEVSPTLVLVCAHCSRAFPGIEQAEDHTAKSAECIEAFANEIKEESDEAAMQLSPATGIVRHTVKITESAPKEEKLIKREVTNNIQATNMLSPLSDAARSIIRVVMIDKAFRCEYCQDVFYIEEGLNNHRKIHKDVKNPFTCHICKVSFATYSRCTTHKTTHGFYKRSLADAKRRNDNEIDNESDEKAGPTANGILGYGGFPVVKHFLCEDCGRSYLHWTYLQVHRRMKHAPENYMHKCTACDNTFQNSWSLAYHKKKAHGRTGLDDISKTRDDYSIPCRDCEEILPNKTALYKHRKNQHSDMLFRSDKQGVLSTSGMCCQRCGQDFKFPSLLQAHVKEQHCVPRLHTCGECGREFRTPSILQEHTRVHTGERPFPCDVCGVAFRRSTAMRNHRLIHTGVRAWACARCPKRFRIRSDLRTHLRLKHPTHLAVIEIKGLNPSPDQVLACLSANNILQDKVIEISKMTFTKGSSGIVPNSTKALSMMSGVPKTPVAYSRPNIDHSVEEFQPVRRGRGIAKNPRRPKILQTGTDITGPESNLYPISINVSSEDMNDIRVELVLNSGDTALMNQ